MSLNIMLAGIIVPSRVLPETTSGEGRDRAPRNKMAAKPGKPRQSVAPSDKVPSTSKRAPSSASGAKKW